MFEKWSPDLDDIPYSMRENVTWLCRPRIFKMHQKVLDFDQEEQDMYLIVEGSAILF